MVLGAAHRSFDFLFSGAFPHDWAARHCSYGEEMTDRELLEMAAKAAGLEYTKTEDHDRLLVRGDDKLRRPWNPLEDDGDALRLAAKLKIGMIFDHGLVLVGKSKKCFADEMAEDYKYAIVRAAAQIGKEMK